MNKAVNHDVIENMLLDMRHHVSGLQDKLSIAGAAVNKSQTVNEKILIMKEYQDKVSTMNSCWRSKNRQSLVANLQHENRQMIALEEENRQLRLALKEMEEGLHLIMADYRRVISGFSRTEVMLDFAQKQCQKNVGGCVEHEKFMEFAALVEQCMASADEKISEQDGVIAELRLENATLRELAHLRPKLSQHERPNANENSASKSRVTNGRKKQDTEAGSLSWPFHVDRPKFGDATTTTGSGGAGTAKASQKKMVNEENNTKNSARTELLP